MSHHSEKFMTAPRILTFSPEEQEQAIENVQLVVKGQGVLVLKDPDQGGFYIDMTVEDNTMSFRLTKDGGQLVVVENGEETIIAPSPELRTNRSPITQISIDKDKEAAYWLSLECTVNPHDTEEQVQIIKFGIGEVREALVQFNITLTDYAWLNQLSSFTIPENVLPIEVYRDPVVLDPPLAVIPTDEISIDDIALNRGVVPANLTAACQILYKNISGKNFQLNTPEFPHFVDAIEASIKTPGAWCYETLKNKADEFGEDNPEETYLRITLGDFMGESPGIPYVIEIWPPGHFSPIHNHAQANAIIRVLHGDINVKLFPMLSKYHEEPFKEVVFHKDQVTWITPRYNQTHQLINVNKQGPTCITIQCYMYGADNTAHYKYFDFIGEDGQIDQFTPNSDADFVSFKATMLKEWNERRIQPAL